MEILRYAALPALPWGTGKGNTTRRLAAGPGWEISSVVLASPARFPALPGTDRSITVVDGEVLELTVEPAAGSDGPAPAVHRMEKFRPLRVPGDIPVAAGLPTGPVAVLSIATERATKGAGIMVTELSRKQPPFLGEGQFAVLLQGSASVTDGGGSTPLGQGDLVAGSPDSQPRLLGRGFAALISVYDH